MILVSITEIISVGAIIPFLAVLTAPEKIYQHELMDSINNLLNITAADQLLLPLTIAFAFTILSVGAIRLLLLFVITRLSFATGADLSINAYRRTLYQDYEVHVSRNSSEIVNAIIVKTSKVTSSIVKPVLNLISTSIVIIAIVGAIFVINFAVALSVTIGFGLLYAFVIMRWRKKLSNNSQVIASHSTEMVKCLQEGLGGIRDVLIDGSQEFYTDLYRNADLPLRKAEASNQLITGSPRFIIEAIGMTVLAVIAFIMSLEPEGLISALPVLGALALGAQRLLPALQMAYSSYGQLKYTHSSFQDVLDLLSQPLPQSGLTPDIHNPVNPVSFESELEINDLSFRYSEDSPWVLKNNNLKLNKGSRTGFIGVTGSGKSTLLDVLMGLLLPSSGTLSIDGEVIAGRNRRAWQSKIAHVPQNIYLSDGTIEENIALGVPKDQIDHTRIKKVAKQAQILDFINSLQDDDQALVGEMGVRLSGGQRQRIGIARALYKQASVLIFDEATSALDNETEQAVMEAIEVLDKDLTILIIAHRVTTLKGCDQIVQINKNGGLSIGSYLDLVKHS